MGACCSFSGSGKAKKIDKFKTVGTHEEHHIAMKYNEKAS